MWLWSSLRDEAALPLIRNYESFFLFTLSPVGHDKSLFGVDDHRAVLTRSLHLGVRRPTGASPELHDWPASRPPLRGDEARQEISTKLPTDNLDTRT